MLGIVHIDVFVCFHNVVYLVLFFFFSSRRRHTRLQGDWSSDVCSSDIALFSGYFAYLPAEAAGVSAVLAAVTVGIYVGWYTPELTTVQTRLQGDAVWEIVVFLLNALLFALVGLQLRPILDGLSGHSTG